MSIHCFVFISIFVISLLCLLTYGLYFFCLATFLIIEFRRGYQRTNSLNLYIDRWNGVGGDVFELFFKKFEMAELMPPSGIYCMFCVRRVTQGTKFGECRSNRVLCFKSIQIQCFAMILYNSTKSRLDPAQRTHSIWVLYSISRQWS